MPTDYVYARANFFRVEGEKAFVDALAASTAHHMAACRPGETTTVEFDPQTEIDVVMIEARYSSHVTAAVLVTIVTYGWPDRMRNLNERIDAIASDVLPLIPAQDIPEGMDAIAVTFQPKPEGSWVSKR